MINDPALTPLQETILGDKQFVEAIFRDVVAPYVPAKSLPRVTIRPVAIKGIRHLQFVSFDGTQETAQNYLPVDASRLLDTLFSGPVRSIQVMTTHTTFRVQFSKKGRAIVHREKYAQPDSIPVDMSHDRPKPYLLPADRPVAFLQAIGVMTTAGTIHSKQQRKFRQINEFLRLIDESRDIERLERRPLRVVDLGCGSAALTFATYHYLTEIKSIPTKMTGVDTKNHLMERLGQTAAELVWPDLTFETSRILEYDPADNGVEIILALHACDTATDEALAQAVRWQSKLIFSAPCCHHHLQAQLSANEPPLAFHPVTRHGILRERLGDILTDAFRALILRLLGYRTDVIEFVPIEHTPKNLMIRGINDHLPPAPALVEEYQQLKAFWNVTPYLETLLQTELAPIMAGS